MAAGSGIVGLVQERKLTGMVIPKPLRFPRLCLTITLGKADIQEPLVNARTVKSVHNCLIQNCARFLQSVQIQQNHRRRIITLENAWTVLEADLSLDECLLKFAGINVGLS